MGGKSCKPVVDPSDADRALKKSARVHFKREFVRLAALQKSSKENKDSSKIHKDVFTKYLALTLGDGLPGAVMDRLFQVLDTNTNGTIEYDEFLAAMYVIWYGTREHKMKLVFNLFDLDASGFVTKKHFKRITTALIQPPMDRKEEEKMSKTFGPLADQLTYFTFYWFDRNKDTLLGYGEWLGYANEDDQILGLIYRMRARGPHAPDKRKDYQKKRDGEGGLSAGTPATSTSTPSTPTGRGAASASVSSSTSSPVTPGRSLVAGSRSTTDTPPVPRGSGIARPPTTAPPPSSAAVVPSSPAPTPAAAPTASSSSAPVVATATGPLPRKQ